MSSGSTGEDLGLLLQPWPVTGQLLTKPPGDTILVPDFRWQLHSKSTDPLENSVSYFSRWVWLDFGVGCLGDFFVCFFCLVWVCLRFFYDLYPNCFDGSLKFLTGYACATFKKSFNNWHCKLCQSWAVLANSRAATAVLAIPNCYFLPRWPWSCHVLLRKCTQARQPSGERLLWPSTKSWLHLLFNCCSLWHSIQ